MKKLMPKPKGFTIIEVIIVLVVGAVIMLAVFLVVPQLQQTQRNTRRLNDARRVLTAVTQISNTQGDLGNNGDDITQRIINITGALKDPDGLDYVIKKNTSTLGNRSYITVTENKKCKSNRPTSSINSFVDSIGSFAVAVSLEPWETFDNILYTTTAGYHCVSN